MRAIPANMLLGAASGRARKGRKIGSGGIQAFSVPSYFHSLVNNELTKTGAGFGADAGIGVKVKVDKLAFAEKSVERIDYGRAGITPGLNEKQVTLGRENKAHAVSSGEIDALTPGHAVNLSLQKIQGPENTVLAVEMEPALSEHGKPPEGEPSRGNARRLVPQGLARRDRSKSLRIDGYSDDEVPAVVPVRGGKVGAIKAGDAVPELYAFEINGEVGSVPDPDIPGIEAFAAEEETLLNACKVNDKIDPVLHGTGALAPENFIEEHSVETQLLPRFDRFPQALHEVKSEFSDVSREFGGMVAQSKDDLIFQGEYDYSGRAPGIGAGIGEPEVAAGLSHEPFHRSRGGEWKIEGDRSAAYKKRDPGAPKLHAARPAVSVRDAVQAIVGGGADLEVSVSGSESVLSGERWEAVFSPEAAGPGGHVGESTLRGLDGALTAGEKGIIVSDIEKGIVERIGIIHEKGSGFDEVRVKLVPPELGEVRIRISMKERKVRASFVVETSSVKAVIDEGSGRLSEAISKQGFVMDHLDVSVENSQKQGSGDPALDEDGYMARTTGKPPKIDMRTRHVMNRNGIDVLA